MKIFIGKHSGFCWGVRRAMDRAVRASALHGHHEPVQMLGPLIHNPQALDHLHRRGMVQANNLQELQGGTVVVRAHGIPQGELRFLKACQTQGLLRLCNATCPEVGRVQGIIKRWSAKGYYVVILGSETHSEVIAHRSFASCGCAVVATPAQVEAIPTEALAKVLVVAQTTFLTADFQTLVDTLRPRAGILVVKNTICQETWVRQNEARTLVQKVEAVVVVGGKVSNNTLHLVEVARAQGRPVQHVETALELDLDRLRDRPKVGVLAGASTPNWIVEEVVEALENCRRGGFRPRSVLRAAKLVQGPQAIAVAALTLWINHVLAWKLSWGMQSFPALLLLGLCAVSPYLDPMGLGTKGPLREAFLKRNRGEILGFGIAALAGASAGAWMGGPWFLAGASLVVTVYLAFLLGGRTMRGRRCVRLLPGIKDAGQAFVVPFLIIGLPWLKGAKASWTEFTLAFGGLAAMALAAHAWRHFRDLQEDQVLGPETLVVAMGIEPTRLMTIASLVMGILSMGALGLLAGPAKLP